MEIVGELSDLTQVTTCGSFRVITTLEFFEHLLA
jgi:hypothetical protein